MNSDGSNQVDLSNNGVGDYSPNWQHVSSNVPPAVSITSPANGASFTAPANIAISATASDSDGTISKVEFYRGTTLLGTDTTAPYSFDWNNVAAGSYSLTAKAFDNAGATTTSSPVTITVNAAPTPTPTPTPAPNQPPIANAGGPYSAETGTAVQFNGSGSSDPDGTITSYAWTFGGGGTGSGATPSHTYTTAGTYTATLTVTDNNGAQASANSTTTITNRPPVANAGGPYSALTGVSIQFNGSGSSDPDGTITSYAWTFGEGGTGSGATPSHTYTTAGTYTATLTVTDNNGATASATATATINPPAIPRDGLASLTFDSTNNRITTAGFAYDAAGNQTRALIAGGTTSQRFQYDAANRLVKVKADDNSTVLATYTYGSSNERLIAEEGSFRTYYACNGSAEYTESGDSTTPSWSKSYVYFGGRLLSTVTPNGSGGEAIQYHHPDRLGTRLVTNPLDGTYFEQQTLPFGTGLNESPPTGGTTDTTNRRFTSYDRSVSTGLDYAVNRHYDPQQGRFTQVDPIGMGAVSLTSPQTLNLYAYCENDPINHVDPSGLGFFSFLKKAFSSVAKFIAKVLTNKWVLLVAGIALGALAGLGFYFAATITTQFYLGAAIALAAMSAILIVGAFHPNFLRVVRTIGGIASTVQGIVGSIRGVINGSVFGTPSWNPNGKVGFSLQGEEVPDDGVLRFWIWAPKWRDRVAGVFSIFVLSIGNALHRAIMGQNAFDTVTVRGDTITLSKANRREVNPCEALEALEERESATAFGTGEAIKEGSGAPGTHAATGAGAIGSRVMPALGGVGAVAPGVGKYVLYQQCVRYRAECNLNPGSCR